MPSLTLTPSGASLQSTLPRGERRDIVAVSDSEAGFNPRSRGGSDMSADTWASHTRSFNPRSRGGSDSAAMSATRTGQSFNPRSRGGSDPIRFFQPLFRIRLQSTLPRGERRVHIQGPDGDCSLQSTLPRGERHSGHGAHGAGHQLQSTLPRGERLSQLIGFEALGNASIHAPAGGATTASRLHRQDLRASIHAPAGGSDGRVLERFPASDQASIHAPAGGATTGWEFHRSLRWASIHAPAGGATSRAHAIQP